MKNSLLLIIAFAFAFSACKKDKPEPLKPIVVTPNDPDLEAYLSFNQGTYWVYKDSISQAIDSVVVSKVEVFNYETEKNDTIFKSYSQRINLMHSFQPKPTIHILYAKRNFAEYQTDIDYMWIPTLFTPFGIAKINTDKGDILTMPNEKPVFINGFTFNKGIEMPWIPRMKKSNSAPSKYGVTDFKITYARDVGMIRREIKNDTLHQIWELVDYKIVR